MLNILAIACCSIDILVWLAREWRGLNSLNPAATIALYTVETPECDRLFCIIFRIQNIDISI